MPINAIHYDSDVTSVIDDLLAHGEIPTVKKLQSALGHGSGETLLKMIKKRMAQLQAPVPAPAPAPVAVSAPTKPAYGLRKSPPRTIEGVVLAEPIEQHTYSLWRALRTDDGELVRFLVLNVASPTKWIDTGCRVRVSGPLIEKVWQDGTHLTLSSHAAVEIVTPPPRPVTPPRPAPVAPLPPAASRPSKSRPTGVCSVQVKLVGRPSDVEVKDGCVTFTLQCVAPQSMPRELPIPQLPPITWTVYVTEKQWSKVKYSFTRDREDRLILEGYPLVDGARAILYVQAVKSLAMERAQRETQKAATATA